MQALVSGEGPLHHRYWFISLSIYFFFNLNKTVHNLFCKMIEHLPRLFTHYWLTRMVMTSVQYCDAINHIWKVFGVVVHQLLKDIGLDLHIGNVCHKKHESIWGGGASYISEEEEIYIYRGWLRSGCWSVPDIWESGVSVGEAAPGGECQSSATQHFTRNHPQWVSICFNQSVVAPRFNPLLNLPYTHLESHI